MSSKARRVTVQGVDGSAPLGVFCSRQAPIGVSARVQTPSTGPFA